MGSMRNRLRVLAVAFWATAVPLGAPGALQAETWRLETWSPPFDYRSPSRVLSDQSTTRLSWSIWRGS